MPKRKDSLQESPGDGRDDGDDAFELAKSKFSAERSVAAKPPRKKMKKLHAVQNTEPDVVDATPAEDKRGIVHFATLPRCMGADKMRHLMEPYGEIGRVYLVAEEKSEVTKRKKTGLNTKARYTEGWVEFAKRKIARRVAETLNATPVGGKKRHNFYRDDIWNIRYLPKFKWHQLKEDTVYNRHVRKHRLDQKINQARRENEFFLEKVDQAKNQKRIDDRRVAKAEKNGSSSATSVTGKSRFGAKGDKAESKGKGNGKGKGAKGKPKEATGDISDRILSSLF